MQPSPTPFLVRRLRAKDPSFLYLEDAVTRLFHIPFHPRSSYEIRGEATQALFALGPAAKPAIPELATLIWDREAGEQAIAILTKLRPDSAPYLISALTNPPSPANPREKMLLEMRQRKLTMAAGVMGAAGQSAIPTLLAQLQSKAVIDRLTAISALERIGQPASVIKPALYQMLHDPNETVRGNAARSLTHLDHPDFRGWTSLRPTGYDPSADFDASQPIDTRLSDALIPLAETDPASNTRESVTVCLLAVNPQGALDAFIKDLNSPDINIRRNCAWNLMRFKKGGHPAVPALLKCLDDPDQKLSQNAAVALREIGQEPDKVVPALLAKLTNADASGQVIFAVALGEFGDAAKPAVPQMLALLKYEYFRSDPNEFDGGAVLSALYKIDPEAATQFQAEAAQHFESASNSTPP
jgi:HEAT repeat protein